MRVHAAFLRSKVARRIFLSFVLCALLPVGALAFLAFDQVSEHLLQQTERRLHRESKALGMSLHERLSLLEAELRLAAHLLVSGARDTTAPAFDAQTEPLGQRFKAIALLRSDGEIAQLVGTFPDAPRPSVAGGDHLRLGGALVSSAATTGRHGRIFVTIALDPPHLARGFLVGEAHPDAFWDLGFAETSQLCVLNAGKEPLFCSSPVYAKTLVEHIAPRAGQAVSGRTHWNYNGEKFVAAYWSVFLKAAFHVPAWTVVVSELEADAFAALNRFKTLFPMVIALALLFVVYLSLSQIRRCLVPLEKLKDGTLRLAGQDFHAQVDITSNDEFEDLADSFNSMAARLQRQFKTLGTLAEIDQIILSALDKDYIVETLLTRMRDVVACDIVCVALAEPEEPGKFLIHVCDENGIRPDQRVSITLDAEEVASLSTNSAYARLDLGENRSNCVVPFTRLGARQCLVFPVVVQEVLSALIVIGYRDEPVQSSEELKHVRELADRAAVALSNAAWEEQLYRQAHYDHLTGLPNRLLLRDRFEQAIVRAERSGTRIALLFLDLDQFKRINDSLGHVAGDQLLKQTASRLSAQLREVDTVGRFGGDEYVILIGEIEAEEDVGSTVGSLSDALLEAVKAPVCLDGHEVNVTASIGIAVFPHDGDNANDLLKHADTAMYHAKAMGRARYAFYARDLNVAAVERLRIETDLRRALETGQLLLHYQPQVEARTGQVIGAEALIRWAHPKWGLVSPERFMAIAEETGLIRPIGEWVLRAVCEQKRQWEARGLRRIRLAVNLSARQFDAGNLVATVTDILQETGTRVDTLELEVTESVLMNDLEATIATLNALNDMGVGLAIDDFGTGHSSLAYLARFPIHCLKIDRSFVQDLGKSDHVRSIVGATIALAHSLDMTVVAEGVETAAQLEILRSMGCDEVQGFLFGRPQLALEFEALLDKRETDEGTRAPDFAAANT